MKKLILLLVIVLVSTLCFSQAINKVYKSSYLEYNGYKWVEKDFLYPEALFITIKNGNIKINNKDESEFYFYGESEKNSYTSHNCYTYDCIDKNGMNLKFMIKIFKEDNTMMMSFVYGAERVMFEYILEKK